MSSILSLDPMSLSNAERHAYLLGAVAPRPIAFASTIDLEGNVNLSPFSFFNVFSSNPPIMVFSPARSGRNNSLKHTHENIREVPETVINIVNYPMVEQTSLASTAYPKGVNEFVKAGFTEVPSEKVKPPRVGEAPVAFECVVDQVIELGQSGGAGNLVIARVVMMHIRKEYLHESGTLNIPKLDLVGRMGESWYARASGDAMFEVPKPLRKQGIGIDQLPAHIRNSHVLTGNQLGRLGNVEALPSEESIAAIRQLSELKALGDAHKHNRTDMQNAIHHLAQNYLEAGQVQKALAILCSIEN